MVCTQGHFKVTMQQTTVAFTYSCLLDTVGFTRIIKSLSLEKCGLFSLCISLPSHFSDNISRFIFIGKVDDSHLAFSLSPGITTPQFILALPIVILKSTVNVTNNKTVSIKFNIIIK